MLYRLLQIKISELIYKNVMSYQHFIYEFQKIYSITNANKLILSQIVTIISTS